MKTFYVYYEGRGYGCDYTIGCNSNVEVYKAENVEEVIREISKEWDDYLPKYVEERYDSITIIEAASITEVDISGYIAKAEAKEEEEKKRREEVKERAEFERLKEKYMTPQASKDTK